MDDTTRRKIERIKAEPDSLLTHFADLANPIAVGWLALRVQGWRRETCSPEPDKEALDERSEAGEEGAA
ncbi:MAG: hypothetical protein JRI25_16910 [Deltaproteobacteria bacterium]|nr:hypothetical protein [Deltaproteobacteria bacterium]